MIVTMSSEKATAASEGEDRVKEERGKFDSS
jgi:hypothetical protein